MKESKLISASKKEDGNIEIDDKMLKIYKDKTHLTIEKIKDVGLPKKNEQIRLITMKSFNSIAFINLVADTEIITNAILVIFAINLEAARILIYLFKSKKIQNLELVISSIRNAGYSIKSKAVKLIAKEKGIKLMFVNSHAKISTMKTMLGNYYTVEGSGNFSYNGRIEQYIIDNDKLIYEFTRKWVNEIKTKMKTKDLLIIN